MIVGHRVTIQGRLLSDPGWRRLGSQTITAEQALTRLMARDLTKL
jgi:hypothetical protein